MKLALFNEGENIGAGRRRIWMLPGGHMWGGRKRNLFKGVKLEGK